jgi:UDP-2,3-diacylglucosamine hydrolase
MSAYFIADCHLQPADTTAAARLERFLDALEPGDQLYILGDLFEIYLGDDAISSWQAGWIQRFRALTQHGVAVAMLAGNRDFLMGAAFWERTGITPLAEPCLLVSHGLRLVVLHGDILCSADRGYRLFRAAARSRLPRALWGMLPVRLRQSLGKRLRQASQQATARKPTEAMQVQEQAVQDLLKVLPCDVMIHGHIHDSGTHRHHTPQGMVNRYVVGCWQADATLACLDAHGLRLIPGPLPCPGNAGDPTHDADGCHKSPWRQAPGGSPAHTAHTAPGNQPPGAPPGQSRLLPGDRHSGDGRG